MRKEMKNGLIYNDEDFRLISRLPQWIQELQDDYPSTVRNTSLSWDEPPIPSGFYVEFMEAAQSRWREPKEMILLRIELLSIICFCLSTISRNWRKTKERKWKKRIGSRQRVANCLVF